MNQYNDYNISHDLSDGAVRPEWRGKRINETAYIIGYVFTD